MYNGLLIKESLLDENILDLISIQNVEIWSTNNEPKYWTAISFQSDCDDFPDKLSKALDEGGETCWYVDFKSDDTKYIVLKDVVLKYEIGNSIEKDTVMKKCMELGVPVGQLDWAE